MNSLWPLLLSEFERCLPRTKSAMPDAAAIATRQKNLRALKSAVSVFGSSHIQALLECCDPPTAQLHDIQNQEIDAALANLMQAVQAPDSQFDDVNTVAETLLLKLKTAQENRLEARESNQNALSNFDVESAYAGTELGTQVTPEPAPADARLSALFALEATQKCQQIERVLLNLEQTPDRLELIVPLMRAAHSIKGAARAVQLDAAVKLAHALEDQFSRAQKRAEPLEPGLIELGLRCNDCINGLAQNDKTAAGESAKLLREMERYVQGEARADSAPQRLKRMRVSDDMSSENTSAPSYIDVDSADPILRIKASAMGEIISLAVTNLVNLDRLAPFAESQQRLRRQLGVLARALESQPDSMLQNSSIVREGQHSSTEHVRHALLSARQDITRWIEEFGDYSRTAYALAERSYHSAAKTRLRPFSDICASYPRIVRDLSKELHKQVQLSIVGAHIEVDRDVLEQLESPLLHLLRNALDHGIELPAQRLAQGKPPEGALRLALSHRAGLLQIELSDDGKGVDLEVVRGKLLSLGHSEQQVRAMGPDALLEQLFAPGFSTRSGVSEISGRGVGLDAARLCVKAMGGTLALHSEFGAGSRFSLTVPISRAVTRALVVKVAEELYAFPLMRVEKVVRASADEIVLISGAEHLNLDARNIGLIGLAEHLELGASPSSAQLNAVIIESERVRLGFVVESIMGEFDLLSKAMDPRLGRVADIAGFSSLPDGSPVILIDVDDLMRNALKAPQFRSQTRTSAAKSSTAQMRKRVLVADDSISVRELVRQLLKSKGYAVETAVDGLDAWNKLRDAPVDLVVTDVDMPRMDGIELVRSIKQDNQLKGVPVVVVSYRDRPEDRARGLEARADAYLTKSDFHEDRFLQVVHDLIGPAPGE